MGQKSKNVGRFNSPGSCSVGPPRGSNGDFYDNGHRSVGLIELWFIVGSHHD